MSPGRCPDVRALRAELQRVDAAIAAHPLASRDVRAAHEVVEQDRSGDAARINAELAARGLPGVEQLGRTQVTGIWSWWRLHRRKRALERRIERAR